MPRAGLSRSAVVELGLAVVDEAGPDGLTLAAVAARAGVAVPSLYKHVGGLADLRREVAVAAVRGLADAVHGAIPSGAAAEPDVRAALRRTADALRGYATAHPGRYLLAQVAPGVGDGSGPLAEANREAVRAVATALAPLLGELTGADLVHEIRVVRAALHGFVLLELQGGFAMPEDVDASYDRLLAVLETGLSATR